MENELNDVEHGLKWLKSEFTLHELKSLLGSKDSSEKSTLKAENFTSLPDPTAFPFWSFDVEHVLIEFFIN